MYYLSTRNNELRMHSMDAIKQGISQEGGLFVPETIPKLSNRDFLELADKDYRSRAFKVLSSYLRDYSTEDLNRIIYAAYGKDNFDCPEIAPVKSLTTAYLFRSFGMGPPMPLRIWPFRSCPTL